MSYQVLLLSITLSRLNISLCHAIRLPCVEIRCLLWSWILIYAFVGIQMGWTLRPFVGDPAMAVRFMRENTWGNAYVVVFESLWRTLTQ